MVTSTLLELVSTTVPFWYHVMESTAGKAMDVQLKEKDSNVAGVCGIGSSMKAGPTAE